MRKGMRLSSPGFVIALAALFVALGGTVYAAGHGKLDGRKIKPKSLPGSRLKPGSLPIDRLRPQAIATLLATPAGQVTGAEIDELSLGQVPEAAHAESATSAQKAI